ncbi:MAG: TonB-dependent receptor [Bryobacteraceae bacterium]
MFRLSRLAALLLSFSALIFGQNSLATITGTVTDATGAVIANVPITVLNLENGGTFRGSSSETGNYTLSQLPIGDYDLTITAPGFKAYTHTKFHLSAGQTMREDVLLEVGNTTDSVTVTADASLLKTESTEVSQNVTLSQLNNLPILVIGATNSGFRDPFAATRLVAGVQYCNTPPACNAVTSLVINGTPANTYQTRLDGMTMNPTSPRLLGAQMQAQPSVDAVEEVAIQTSNFAAEFGTAGGAMINMTTKSGTNAYHGTGYDYAINEALNSRVPYTNVLNRVRQHDWGFTFGGPVRIPKLYNGTNKTFFFFNWERFLNDNVNTLASSVPTSAYRVGNFSSLIPAENRTVNATSGPLTDAIGRTIASGTIFDPLTLQTAANGRTYRDPFVGNQIPLSRIDPVTAKILPLIPNPQGINFSRGLVANNFQGPVDSSRVSAIPSLKLDQNVGGGRLSFYWQRTNTVTPRTPTGADPFADDITASAISQSWGKTMRLNYDYTLTPRLLLHLGAGWNDSFFELQAPISNYNAQAQLGLVGQTQAKYFPRIVTGVNASDSVGGLSPIGTTFPEVAQERRPSGNISATYVSGNHTYKFGGDYRLEKFPRANLVGAGANTSGLYSFGRNNTEQILTGNTISNGAFSGFEFASFLLGGMSSNALVAPANLSVSKTQLAFFAQDTWKVTRKLTFDYGLRWDYGTYAREQYGRNASIGLAIPNPSAGGRLGARQFEQACNCNFANNYKPAFGPRVGLSYQINTKTVLRAGFGVVYNATSTSSGDFSNTATSSGLTALSGQTTGQFKDGLPASVRAVWPSFDPAVGQGNNSVIAMPNLLDRNAGRPARLLQWNIALQREINRNLVIDASYVANRGAWWNNGGASNLSTVNALSVATLQRYGFNDFTSPTESALLTTTVGALSAAQRSTLAARGITGIPYTGFPTNQTVRQSLLDYPQYTGSATSSGLVGAPLGNTWYDSFQLNVTQRFSRGLSFNLNYNYSKNLDTWTTIADVYNRDLSKNLSVNDLPHALRVSVQYTVPSMKNSGLGLLSSRVVSSVLADWGVGLFASYQSGPIIARPTSSASLPISNFLGRGPGASQLKKNADGSYMNPFGVNWTDYDGKVHAEPLDINCHCFDITKTQVYNPAAWENVPNGQWAADYSSLRNYRFQRQPTESLNLSRNFRFTERVTLNVRAEFSNVFNRTRFPTPTNGNFAVAPTFFNTGSNRGLISGGFGTISPYNGTLNSRAGSIVARISF